jgi:hypothetical protein
VSRNSPVPTYSITSSFDRKRPRRNGKAERPGRFYDHPFKLRGASDRKIGQAWRPSRYGRYRPDLTKTFREAWSVTHQAAGRGKLAKLWHTMAHRERSELGNADNEAAGAASSSLSLPACRT